MFKLAAVWIFAGLSASCGLLFVFPYLLYPLVLRLLSKRPIRYAPAELSASLLFCAYNEIACLPAKIGNLRELKRNTPQLQILAYDDGSSDGTYELLAAHPDLLTTVRGPGRSGKAAGMKRLVERAVGDILIFTDADVLLAPDTVDHLLPHYGDTEVGGVCGTVVMTSEKHNVTSHTGSLYWAWDDKLQRLESATGNVMGASGALFSVRRELYPHFPDTVQDDFTVSMSVIFQRKRLIKATNVIAHTSGLANRADELRRKIRIGARAYHTHRFLRPQLRTMAARDRFKYTSRKLLRWFGGMFLALGALFALAAVAMLSVRLATLLLLCMVIVAGLAVRADWGQLGKAGSVLTATFAMLFGVLQGMRGRTVATWAPAKSR